PASAADSGFLGHVGETAELTIVSPEGVTPVARDVHVGIAVAVEVGHGDALAVSLPGETNPSRDVLEPAGAQVLQQHIGGPARGLYGLERTPLCKKEIEPPIAVVIEQSHPATRRLDRPGSAGLASFVSKWQLLGAESERRREAGPRRGR